MRCFDYCDVVGLFLLLFFFRLLTYSKVREIKVRAVLGGGDNDDAEVVILGRVVRWTDAGLEMEADTGCSYEGVVGCR